MAESPEWEGGCFWVTSPGPVPSAKGLWQNHSKGHGEGWTLSPGAPTIGPAGSREVQLWPTDLGVLAWGFSEGAQNGVQGSLAAPGPQAAAPRGRAAGKGKVTSLPPGICCLEASPWRPEGSGWVKIANPRGCKFQESESEKRKEYKFSLLTRTETPSWRLSRGRGAVVLPGLCHPPGL